MAIDKKVISSYSLIGQKGEIKIICQMLDGSIWSCDNAGKNWKKEKLSDDELTKTFYKICPHQE